MNINFVQRHNILMRESDKIFDSLAVRACMFFNGNDGMAERLPMSDSDSSTLSFLQNGLVLISMPWITLMKEFACRDLLGVLW